ncbi:MAG: hypothetical protein WCA32_02075, partial [Chromatiaceae bacterium]
DVAVQPVVDDAPATRPGGATPRRSRRKSSRSTAGVVTGDERPRSNASLRADPGARGDSPEAAPVDPESSNNGADVEEVIAAPTSQRSRKRTVPETGEIRVKRREKP